MIIGAMLTGCASARKEGDSSATEASSEAPFESSSELYTETTGVLAGKTICIDAGHGVTDRSEQEAVAPGSGTMKAAFVSGTHGATLTEEQLNLIVALKVEERLRRKGATVVMTRTSAECDLSNADRAKMANEAGADIMVRIHADGSENPSAKGMSILVPTSVYIDDEEMIEKSRLLGEIVLEEAVNSTGAVNRGVYERSDIAGFNWSEAPVVLIEMGFMTNSEEDELLSTDEYQDKIADGIVKGIERCFSM